MGTTAIETTPVGRQAPDGSLEQAADAFSRILSPKREDGTATGDKPEQREDARPTATQAPAATEKTGSEQAQAASTEETTEAQTETEAPRTHKITVAGKEIEVTEEELRKGYSREADYTRKSQELAAARQKFETEEAAAVRAERAQYEELLAKLKTVVNPVEPDWIKLRNELGPDEFSARFVEYTEAKKARDSIDAEEQRLAAIRQAEAVAGFNKHVAAEREKLVAILPDFNDAAKAEVLTKELGEFARTMGFDDSDLGAVTDHRLVVLLHKAMQGEKAARKAPEIKSKIEQSIATSAPGAKSNPTPKNELRAANERLKQSGRVEDAADVFKHLMRPKT